VELVCSEASVNPCFLLNIGLINSLLIQLFCCGGGSVIADGHISWACEAFSKLHAPEFLRSRSLAG